MDVLCVVHGFFADRTNFYLNGSEPQRKCSGIVFDQDTEEAFDRAEQRAMNHQRLVASAIGADIFEAEARGQVEIELHSGELPGPADGIN